MNSKQMDKNDIPKLASMRFEFSLERLILELIIELSNTWLFASTEEETSKFGKLKEVMDWKKSKAKSKNSRMDIEDLSGNEFKSEFELEK